MFDVSTSRLLILKPSCIQREHRVALPERGQVCGSHSRINDDPGDLGGPAELPRLDAIMNLNGVRPT